MLNDQIPSIKLQTIFNFQNSNDQNILDLEFEFLNLFEICDLLFGISLRSKVYFCFIDKNFLGLVG